eukprot:s145_g9.t1
MSRSKCQREGFTLPIHFPLQVERLQFQLRQNKFRTTSKVDLDGTVDSGGGSRSFGGPGESSEALSVAASEGRTPMVEDRAPSPTMNTPSSRKTRPANENCQLSCLKILKIVVSCSHVRYAVRLRCDQHVHSETAIAAMTLLLGLLLLTGFLAAPESE